MQDHYALLGVPRTASHDEIQAAFRSLIKTAHPDATGDQSETEASVRLNLAWHHLGDTNRRAAYDRQLGTPQAVPNPTDGEGELQEIFERLVQSLIASGLTRRQAINLTLAEIARLANHLLDILQYPPQAMMGGAVIDALHERQIAYDSDELLLALNISRVLRKIGRQDNWYYKLQDREDFTLDDLAWLTGKGRYAQ